jgi:hypothetical protein
MKTGNDLIGFMNEAREDPRLSPLHLSVFLALIYLRAEQESEHEVQVSARQLMPLAKIASPGPYHRVIRELDKWGYIRYEASFDKRVGSRVWLGEEKH